MKGYTAKERKGLAMLGVAIAILAASAIWVRECRTHLPDPLHAVPASQIIPDSTPGFEKKSKDLNKRTKSKASKIGRKKKTDTKKSYKQPRNPIDEPIETVGATSDPPKS